MGFFMVIVFLVIVASLAAVAYRFVQSAKNISHRHKLEIEQEKTKQFKLAAGIVDEFDAQPIIDRLEERIKRIQTAAESNEKAIRKAAEFEKDVMAKEYKDTVKYYERMIREYTAFPSPIVGYHRETDTPQIPTEWMPRSRPIVHEEALTEEQMLALELKKAIAEEMNRIIKDEED